jgi:hypothetical protein
MPLKLDDMNSQDGILYDIAKGLHDSVLITPLFNIKERLLGSFLTMKLQEIYHRQ